MDGITVRGNILKCETSMRPEKSWTGQKRTRCEFFVGKKREMCGWNYSTWQHTKM